MTELRLWEVEHPYYCSESNYFSREYTTQYSSWESFIEEEGTNDLDMNLVFRWDWQPHDSFGDGIENRQEYAARFGDRDHAWTLWLFWMLQRKGIFRVTPIEVCKANEPDVRAWLLPRLQHLQLMWEPLTATPGEAS